MWTLGDVSSQAGKRFLITGGNSGVGYWAAVELARRGAEVVLACRDKARAEAAAQQLKVDSGGGTAEVIVLDLLEGKTRTLASGTDPIYETH